MVKLYNVEPLSEYEEGTLLPVMVECLRNHVGDENAVTNSFMCDRLKLFGYKANPARIRKIINRIRIDGEIDCLIASSSGYYISDDPAEVQGYIESLKDREGAIRAMRNALERQLEKMPAKNS